MPEETSNTSANPFTTPNVQENIPVFEESVQQSNPFDVQTTEAPVESVLQNPPILGAGTSENTEINTPNVQENTPLFEENVQQTTPFEDQIFEAPVETVVQNPPILGSGMTENTEVNTPVVETTPEVNQEVTTEAPGIIIGIPIVEETNIPIVEQIPEESVEEAQETPPIIITIPVEEEEEESVPFEENLPEEIPPVEEIIPESNPEEIENPSEIIIGPGNEEETEVEIGEEEENLENIIPIEEEMPIGIEIEGNESFPGFLETEVISGGGGIDISLGENGIEIELPLIDFENGETSISNGISVGGHTYLIMALLDDMDGDALASQLQDSQQAAVQDNAIKNYLTDRLNVSKPSISDNAAAGEPFTVNLGNTQPNTNSNNNNNNNNINPIFTDDDIIDIITGQNNINNGGSGSTTNNNNPTGTQNQNVPVTTLNRTIALANWTGIPTESGPFEPNTTLTQNTTNLTFLLNFGAGFTLAQGIQASLLPVTNYNVSAIYNISQQNLTDLNASIDGASLIDLLNGVTVPNNPNVTYKVDIQLINYKNFTANISFFTEYLPENNTWQTSSCSYEYLLPDNQTLVNVNWTSEFGNYTINVTNLTNLALGTLGNSSLNNTLSFELNQTQYLALSGYSLVQNISTYDRSAKLRYLMLAGANYVINQGITYGLLTNSTYNFTQINSVYVRYDSLGNDVLYRYDIDLDNNGGTTARVNFEVYYAVDAEIQTFGFYNSTINNKLIAF